VCDACVFSRLLKCRREAKLRSQSLALYFVRHCPVSPYTQERVAHSHLRTHVQIRLIPGCACPIDAATGESSFLIRDKSAKLKKQNGVQRGLADGHRARREVWLRGLDSNQDNQIQSLVCYQLHYPGVVLKLKQLAAALTARRDHILHQFCADRTAN
jgi:hypothetical protein